MKKLIVIPDEILENLNQLAKDENRKLSNFIKKELVKISKRKNVKGNEKK